MVYGCLPRGAGGFVLRGALASCRDEDRELGSVPQRYHFHIVPFLGKREGNKSWTASLAVGMLGETQLARYEPDSDTAHKQKTCCLGGQGVMERCTK